MKENRTEKAIRQKTAVDDRKKPAASLKVSESRYRRLFETAQEGILLLDAETGQVVDVNPFLVTLLGYSYREFMGKKLWELGLFKDIAVSQESFARLQSQGYVRYENLPLETKGGSPINVEFISHVYEVDRQRVIQCTIRDIAERRKLENGLEKTRKELEVIKKSADEVREYAESIINTVREPLISLDQDLRVVTASRSFYEVFKVNPQETVGQLIYDLGNKQWNIPKLRELLETILPQKTTFENYEVEHDFATIGRRIMLLNARQIQRVLGKERIILLAIEDITERKKIESGLEKTRQQLEIIKQSADEASEFAESVINTVREPLIALDQDLRVVKVSRSFYEVFKVKPEETMGQLIYDLGNKQWNIPKLRELLETILPQKATFDNYEVEHDFATIGRRIMLLNARQIQRVLGKERIILLAIEDITERKQTEKALRELEGKYHLFMEKALVISEETLHLVVESLIVGITVTDLKGTILQTNQALHLLHGFQAKGEVIGRNTLEFIDKIDQTRAMENMNKMLVEGSFKDVEFTLLRADGSNFAAELSAAVIKDTSGTLQGMVFITREITERKRLDQERARFTEEIKQKNTELERFTYTVSHDLKSPLVTIKTFLGYLKQDIPASDAGRIEQDMLYMNGAADKMGNLLGELLEMSRIGRVVNPAVAVTFQELVQETLSLVAGRLEERGVKVQVSDENITLYGDRPRLVEVWQNLVENAVKFIGDQPSPSVDIGVDRRDGETIFFVRDNGIGIDPQYQPRLFNLFEKINPKSEGTGMGLAIIKRIVELYQGKIWVDSRGLGQGTCFRFTLPGALKNKSQGG